MRRLFLVVLLLALAGTAGAIDIKGKWGLGVGTGDFLGSGAEASLIRGKTERTAWILDLDLYQSYSELRTDSTGRIFDRDAETRLTLGPRIRRYSRPQAKLSPYVDGFFHLRGSGSNNLYGGRYNAGGELGFAGGAEYFTPWHFGLAAHTGILSVAVERIWDGQRGQVIAHGWRVWSIIGISPRVQLRVYF
jgi:hypothetical protein